MNIIEISFFSLLLFVICLFVRCIFSLLWCSINDLVRLTVGAICTSNFFLFLFALFAFTSVEVFFIFWRMFVCQKPISCIVLMNVCVLQRKRKLFSCLFPLFAVMPVFRIVVDL